jgi:unsaturated rhamnogalacturonyl hydrolase
MIQLERQLSRKELNMQIQRIIHGITDANSQTMHGGRHFMEVWDWYQGVALFGLYTYYKDTRNQDVLDYLRGWYNDHIEKGLPAPNINSMCPLLTLSYLYEELKVPEWLDILGKWLDCALYELPRTTEGGLQHKTIDSDNKGQLWDDTLYMTVLFIARMGVLLGREDCIQESIRQFLIHIKYLSDQVTGLFFHGWTFEGFHHFGEALWGRGNAWYTAGLVDYLEITTVNEGVKQFLISTLTRQAEALKRFQDVDGMWHTLIDQPDTSYQESSATAGFGYGILKAVRHGYLDRSFTQMGLNSVQAILKRIDASGVLQQVSAGTCVGVDLDYYRTIPIAPQPYGQSMALLLLMEATYWCDERS